MRLYADDSSSSSEPAVEISSSENEQPRSNAEYAQSLFAVLNEVVFFNRLPSTTTVRWSARLLSTAGRAKWRRGRDGLPPTTEIELATKILDSNQRIRNTLAHEMCHLACWVINHDFNAGHGQLWKGWAAKVMKHRPDIEINTKHNYDISYPYRWRCESCEKSYGRFTDSIRTDEVVCSACRVGSLIPLFTPRPRAPRTPARKTTPAPAISDDDDAPQPKPDRRKKTPKKKEADRDVPRQKTPPPVATKKPSAASTEPSNKELDDSDIEVLEVLFKAIRIPSCPPVGTSETVIEID